MKKGLKETWGRCGLWLGAGQAKAMGSKDAGITELPSFERGILSPFFTRTRDEDQELCVCVREILV